MKKSLVVALVLLTSFVAPPAAQAQAQAQWMQALEARSQELNRAYGLGASTIDRIHAQERGRALDFGLAERPVLVVAAAEEGFDWSDAGVGGAAVLALALLATGALAFRPGRRQQSA